MTYKYKRMAPLSRLLGHLKGGPNLIQVIVGPRQVGKTTAILQFVSDSGWPSLYDTADLLSPPSAAWIEEKWNLARGLADKEGRALLVLDEVQKVPRWSDAIKRFHDEDVRSEKNVRAIILGSSALMVQRGLKESLAGRFEITPFGHWTFAECSEAFSQNIDEFIFFGGYPGAISLYLSDRDEMRWQQYVRDALIETVIGKDILQLTPVEKPALFRQVFQLACAHPAEILAYVKMAGQLQDAGNTTTIASYLQLMQAAGIVAPLQKYSGSAVRQRASSPKILILDGALTNAAMSRTFDRTRNDPETWGRLVENAAGAYLHNQFEHFGVQIHYWRERDDEVDYVLSRGDEIAGIEIKSGRQSGRNGLKAFRRRYDKAKALVIGGPGGDMTIEEFLKSDLCAFF